MKFFCIKNELVRHFSSMKLRISKVKKLKISRKLLQIFILDELKKV